MTQLFADSNRHLKCMASFDLILSEKFIVMTKQSCHLHCAEIIIGAFSRITDFVIPALD
jgi:hypothetical protein